MVLLRANLFSAEGRGEPRCACHLGRNAFHYPAPPGGPSILSATEAPASWDCLSFLPPRALRLASHLLLRAALKTDKSVFSQSSQGPLGPPQSSVLLVRAQRQQQPHRNDCPPHILSPRPAAGIISPVLEMGKLRPRLSFVTCPRCHDESVEAPRCLPRPPLSFPPEKRRGSKISQLLGSLGLALQKEGVQPDLVALAWQSLAWSGGVHSSLSRNGGV